MPGSTELNNCLASVDSDIVQALTAVQKRLLSNSSIRGLNEEEKPAINSLFIRCSSVAKVVLCLHTTFLLNEALHFLRRCLAAKGVY